MQKRLSDDAGEGAALLASMTSTKTAPSTRSTAVQELVMAASITVEEERGTFTRSVHPHNGYWAGDFSRYPADRPVPSPQYATRPHS